MLVQRTVDALNSSSEARQIRVSQEKRNISPIVYCFLWQMAFVTYLGVIFLQVGSQLMNTCVALLTITSVTTSMLILADLEKPYDGLVRVETDIFNIIRRDISVVLHDAEGGAGETGDHDEPETCSKCVSSDTGAGHIRGDDGAAAGDGAGFASLSSSRLEEPRPARIRSMSMRTKIDADYHMRKAVSQIGRLRRHSVDCSDMQSPAQKPLVSLSAAKGSDNTLASTDKSDSVGGRENSKKYRVAPLPNAMPI